MEKSTSGLWLPRAQTTTTEHRRESPPVTGEKFGQWASNDLQFASLPGGGVLQFDLDRLTVSDFRMMRDHYQINANLTLLTFMLHQIDWHVECSNREIANFCEEELAKVWTQLIRGMGQSLWSGYSPMAVQYENDVPDRKIRLDKIKDLHPQACEVNWKQVKGYSKSGIKPNINVFDGIKQWGQRDPIPVDNSFWYPLLMEHGNHYGRKLLRPAFVPWFFSNLIHLFANRYFERFGEPLPIGRADYEDQVEWPNAAGGTDLVSGREAMQRILNQLRSRSVVTLPSDRDPETKEYTYDLEYLESQMRGADFERYLTRLDEEMSLGLFTPILMLRTADVGSYNLGVNHMQVWMWMLNALAGDMKFYIDKYLLRRLKAFNFNKHDPEPSWVFKPMGKQNTETIRAIVTELVRGGRVEPRDLREMGESIGLELKEIRQITEEPTADPDDGEGREGEERTPGRRARSDGPAGPESTRNTQQEINARIRPQVVNAFKRDTIGTSEFAPVLGYRKKMEQSFAEDGFSEDAAAVAASNFYARMEDWLDDFREVKWDDADDFMATIDAKMSSVLESMYRED